MRDTSLRTVLAVAAADSFTLLQLDRETDFLNGELEEEIYICQRHGYERGYMFNACRLLKALYELKQAARTWYKTLREILLTAGFTPSAFDQCLL